MGMYTELVLNVAMRENLPKEVVDVLSYMARADEINEMPSPLPDHPIFRTTRWPALFVGNSYYFIPFSSCKFLWDDIADCYYLSVRADIKNYDGEISKFLDWFCQYVDPHHAKFLGYQRYEEDDEPTLIFHPGWGE